MLWFDHCACMCWLWINHNHHILELTWMNIRSLTVHASLLVLTLIQHTSCNWCWLERTSNHSLCINTSCLIFGPCQLLVIVTVACGSMVNRNPSELIKSNYKMSPLLLWFQFQRYNEWLIAILAFGMRMNLFLTPLSEVQPLGYSYILYILCTPKIVLQLTRS